MAAEPQWDLGRRRRLARILSPVSGRAVVVAVDHGLFIGPLPGAEDLTQTVAAVAAGGADAVQLTPGAALSAGRELIGPGRPTLVLRMDATNVWRPKPKANPTYHARVASPMDAVRLGADAAVCFLFVGYENDRVEGENLETVASWASQCRELGMPLVVEPLALQPGGQPVRDPDLVRLMVRMAWEAGADIVKADYTGDKESFRGVIQSVPVPVLVRGGPRCDTVEETLILVADALEAGASGVVFGRNVWQQPDVPGAVRAIRHLCHEGGTVRQALALAGQAPAGGGR